ncbi:ATP-binding protein [Paenibacillus rigui]|uniref:ATP-binding protein n=2 Tax=Paenibacillus rigui TaxID=554312 RepID=A0A229ULU0_9BACL|nr:ATP-binding protein [Paenibacillus rigui]
MYLEERKLEELSFFRKLSIYGQKMGIEVLVFTPDDIHASKSRIQALYYNTAARKWQRKWTYFPELIYDRCRYHGMENYRKISRFRSQYNRRLKYLSNPLANKWSMHQILSENEEIASHLPATVRYNGSKELIQFLKKYQRIYLKPRSGTGGRGIIRLQMTHGSGFLMQGRDQNRHIIRPQRVYEMQISAKLSTWKLNDRYIVQQGIPLSLKDGRVHDFRMLVQKNGKGEWEITGCAGRVGPRNSVTSNLHGGGTAVPMDTLLLLRFENQAKVEEIKEEAYKLGMNVAEFIEKKFGQQVEIGIDLAIDPKGKVWLLEVNPKPSREVFHKIGETETYRKAITRPLEYASWLMKRKKSKKE